MCRFYVQGIEHYTRCSPLASSLPLSPSLSLFLSLCICISIYYKCKRKWCTLALARLCPTLWQCQRQHGDFGMLHVACCVLCAVCVACTHPERHWHWTSPDTIRSRPKCEKAVGNSLNKSECYSPDCTVNVTNVMNTANVANTLWALRMFSADCEAPSAGKALLLLRIIWLSVPLSHSPTVPQSHCRTVHLSHCPYAQLLGAH